MSASTTSSSSCGNPFAYGLCGCVPKMQQPESLLWYTVDEACMVAEVGDLILCSGHGFATVLAEAFSSSMWSHVGIVCKDSNGRPGLIEAVRHGDDVPAIGRLKPTQKTPYIGGVRVVDLRTKLEQYRGYAIGIKALRCKNESEANLVRSLLSVACRNFLDKFHGNDYDSNYFDFVDARFRFRSPVHTEEEPLVLSNELPRDKPFFCSELVAQILIDANVLSPRYGLASQYLPIDFAEKKGVQLQRPNIKITKTPEWGPIRFVAIPYAYKNLLDRILSLPFLSSKPKPQVSQHAPPSRSIAPYPQQQTLLPVYDTEKQSTSPRNHYQQYEPTTEPIPLAIKSNDLSSFFVN